MRKIYCMILVLMLVLGLSLGAAAAPSSSVIVTTATGYDSADDVHYVTYSGSVAVTSSTSYTLDNVIANWGARGELCTFLSTYAENYYINSYDWERMSALSGGTGTSDAFDSQLYTALQSMMQEMHTQETSYGQCRAYFAFTDCSSSDYAQLTCFYTGTVYTGYWSSGTLYDREHTWPKSKTDYPKVNNNSVNEASDIMSLRPAAKSENSSRGNKAYGESSGYYDPGVSVRGDCARIMLYVYVRWGNIENMWGSDGVMESLDILLEWMEEDPVDTWEMGRNDSVQSITGTRNVFVDYPEYAWLLFGQEVPEDLVTPSGEAANQDAPAECAHSSTEVRNATAATCVDDGYTGDTYCTDCSQLLAAGSVISATGKHTLDETGHCTGCDYFEEQPCTHEHTTIGSGRGATCVDDGYTGDEVCDNCGYVVKAGQVIPATGEHILDETGHCVDCDYAECQHTNVTHQNQKDATCVAEGYTGDVYCADCGEFIAGGSVIPATGEHIYAENGVCFECGYDCGRPATQPTTAPDSQPGEPQEEETDNNAWIVIGIGAALVIFVLSMRKKRRRK